MQPDPNPRGTLPMLTSEEYDALVASVQDDLVTLQLRAPYRACQLIARDMEQLSRGLTREEIKTNG